MLRPSFALTLILLSLCAAARGSSDSVEPAPPSPAAQAYDAGSVRFLATSAQTGGRFAVVDVTENGGYFTPPHRHDSMDETFFVLEGTLRVVMHGRSIDYPKGSYVLIPRGAVHAQGSASQTEPVRVIITMTPGGFEDFFTGRVELATRIPLGDPGFLEEMMALLQRNSKWIQPVPDADPSQ